MTLLRMLALHRTDSAPTARPAAAPARRFTQSESAAAAARTRHPVRAIKKKQCNAQWAEIVEKLGLTGMARMLAQHCNW